MLLAAGFSRSFLIGERGTIGPSAMMADDLSYTHCLQIP
jgi:hypothetical protein